MLFVEGNHCCPGCEKSGNCQLQALAYDLEMFDAAFRAILSRARGRRLAPGRVPRPQPLHHVRALRARQPGRGRQGDVRLAGRGRDTHIIVNSPTGKLGDTAFSIDRRGRPRLPVGAILPKEVGFVVPIGERNYDETRAI